MTGNFVLFPIGGCWEYCEIENGRLAYMTSQANLGTHVAARDQLAWLADVEMDDLPWADESVAREVLIACGRQPDDDVIVCPVEQSYARG